MSDVVRCMLQVGQPGCYVCNALEGQDHTLEIPTVVQKEILLP